MTKIGYWVVLGFFALSGLVAVGQGAALMAGWKQPEPEQMEMAASSPNKEAFILGVGVGTIFAGAISLLAAWGIFRWRRWGRILAIILCILNLLGFVVASFQTRLGIDVILVGVLVVVSLVWLFSAGTKEAFATGGKPA